MRFLHPYKRVAAPYLGALPKGESFCTKENLLHRLLRS